METFIATFFFILYSPKHIQYTRTEIRITVIYVSWVSPHFKTFTMSQLDWHSSFKQAEEPNTYSAKLIQRRKNFLLVQSYAGQKGQDRIFREGLDIQTPLKNSYDFIFFKNISCNYAKNTLVNTFGCHDSGL